MEDFPNNRIDRVVDYIQANLGDRLTVARLAGIACFSQFHFNRLFKQRTGETVYNFIRRLRLEKAACLLCANQAATITDVALACGFATPSAFAKSFKAHFNVSATQWRNQYIQGFCADFDKKGTPLPQLFFHKGRPAWTFDFSKLLEENCIKAPDNSSSPFPFHFRAHPRYKDQEQSITVAIKELQPVKVAYIRYIGRYQQDAALFDSLYDNLFQWAVPRGLVDNQTPRFSIYQDNPEVTPQQHLRVMIALPIPESIGESDTVGITTLSGGAYAVCRLLLTQNDFIRAWQWMFAAWLNPGGYELDDREMFERYHGEQIRNGIRYFDVDICIPVRAK